LRKNTFSAHDHHLQPNADSLAYCNRKTACSYAWNTSRWDLGRDITHYKHRKCFYQLPNYP